MKKILTGLLLAVTTLVPLSVAFAEPFTLKSPDFTSGHPMPPAMGGNLAHMKMCRGQNISPSLSWENAPAATQSFALIIRDAQGKNGLGITHLLAYGIPGTEHRFLRTALANGQGFVGGKNSFGKLTYDGPCPPANADTHYYTFTLIATDLPVKALPEGLELPELLNRLEGHALGAAGMVGTFGGSE